MAVGLDARLPSPRRGEPAGSRRRITAARAVARGSLAGLLLTAGLLALMPWLGRFGQPPTWWPRCRRFILPVASLGAAGMVTMALKNYRRRHGASVAGILDQRGRRRAERRAQLDPDLREPGLLRPSVWPGAGWATFAARVATGVAFFVWVVRSLPSSAAGGRSAGWPRRAGRCWRACSSSAPRSAWACSPKSAAFNLAGLMAGWIGTTALAAHQIALTCASFTFMAPLGLATATTVRVGACHGANDHARLRAVATGSHLGRRRSDGAFRRRLSLVRTHHQRLVHRRPGRARPRRPAARHRRIVSNIRRPAGHRLRCAARTERRAPAGAARLLRLLGAGPAAGLDSPPFGLGWHAEGIWTGLAVGLAAVAFALVARVRRVLSPPHLTAAPH